MGPEGEDKLLEVNGKLNFSSKVYIIQAYIKVYDKHLLTHIRFRYTFDVPQCYIIIAWLYSLDAD